LDNLVVAYFVGQPCWPTKKKQ